jgi:hypothetical protein
VSTLQKFSSRERARNLNDSMRGLRFLDVPRRYE